MEKKADSSSLVGVLEDYFRSEESESCSLKEPTPDVESKISSKPSSHRHGFVQLLRSKSKKPLATLHPPKAFIEKELQYERNGLNC